MFKICIVLAGLFGAIGVAMGAYTAHGLGFIDALQAREAARVSMQSAVQYQLLHAVVLLAVGLWLRQSADNRALLVAAVLFVLGIVLFSGLIYLQTLTSVQALRSFVPWGGTCFILAWLALAAAALMERVPAAA